MYFELMTSNSVLGSVSVRIVEPLRPTMLTKSKELEMSEPSRMFYSLFVEPATLQGTVALGQIQCCSFLCEYS
jgi:hypothetical protein